MSIIVIRHAAQQISRTDADPGLINPDPLQMPNLPDFYFDRDLILCSPYLRCRQTANMLIQAKMLTGTHPEIQTMLYFDLRLSEAQGKRPNRQIVLKPETENLLNQMIQSQHLPGNTWVPDETETEEAFKLRVNSFINDLQAWQQKMQRKIMVITHGAVVNYWSTRSGGPNFGRGNNVPYLGGFVV